MNTLLRVGLTNAAIAAGLGAVAFLVARLGRRPALGHCLWLIVLLKLVSPPLWGVALPWPTTRPAAEPPRRHSIELTEADLDDLAALPEPEPVPEPARPTVRERVVAWWADGTLGRLAAGAWLAGSAAWFVFMGVRIGRFQRLLRHAEPADEALQGRADELAGRMGLARWPEVRVLPIAVSPLLWAVAGRARLVVPGPLWKRLGAAERDALLAHELAHLRRRDHWARWLELVAVGLHWWNPVAWWARRELERAEEACCDAWVVRALPGSAKAYAKALLKTVDFLAESRPAFPPAASGAGRIPNLKRRVTMILRETLEHRLGAPARLAALAIGLLVLPLAPRPSPAQDPAPNPEPVEIEVNLEELPELDALADVELADQVDDDAKPKAEAKDQGDLEARLKRLEARLDKLAALLEAKGDDGVKVRLRTPDSPEGVTLRGRIQGSPERVVVIRPEDLKRLDEMKARVARQVIGQVRQLAGAEKQLEQARAQAERAGKEAAERQARVAERVARLDAKVNKDAEQLHERALMAVRLPGVDEEQAKKLAAEIDAIVKKHAEAGDMGKIAGEIEDLIKKHFPNLDASKPGARAARIVVRTAPRTVRTRPVFPAPVRSIKVEPRDEGLDQRMDRLEKRLDELMKKLETPSAPSPARE